MSKRFGRNQRRRARERITALEGTAQMQAMLLQSQGEALYEAMRELDEAKDIAGRMSHLFPPQGVEMEVDREPPARGDMFMVDIPSKLQDLPQFFTDGPLFSMRYRRTPLALLMTSIEPDALAHGVQARVRFANKEVAYGITAAAWHSLSTRQRIDRLVRQIAPELSTLLVKMTDLRRYT